MVRSTFSQLLTLLKIKSFTILQNSSLVGISPSPCPSQSDVYLDWLNTSSSFLTQKSGVMLQPGMFLFPVSNKIILSFVFLQLMERDQRSCLIFQIAHLTLSFPSICLALIPLFSFFFFCLHFPFCFLFIVTLS